MQYIVTSDLHLGSKFSRCGLFSMMVQKLNKSVTLILAGDIIDAPGRILDADAEAALTIIKKRATQETVIWIEGNHDENYRPGEPHAIQFVRSYAIGTRLYITHGDTFDNVMPNNRSFMNLFRFFHNLRVRLGAQPVHIADYAKKFTFLYNVLCEKIRNCAVDHGKRENFETVVCGHVHLAEDGIHQGIRYINLGAWTESPCFCLLVSDERIRLMTVEDAMQDSAWFLTD